jgi:uncharacterized glyoxalase superfamily protein PhnB
MLTKPQHMKPPPKGWPRMSASVFYADAHAGIDWLCNAFGFEARLKVEGDQGDIVHSELTLEDALVMVGSTTGKEPWQRIYQSPQAIGGAITQALCFHIDDVDAHHARAVAAGAKIVREPTTNDYGDDYWADRSYGALDPEGHLWWFMQRVRG